jgi:hypothetical protein
MFKKIEEKIVRTSKSKLFTRKRVKENKIKSNELRRLMK